MKLADIILSAGSFITMVVLIILIFVNKSEGGQCLKSPIQFQLEKFSQEGNEAVCQCSFINGNYAPILVTKDKAEPIYNNNDGGEINLNLTFLPD